MYPVAHFVQVSLAEQISQLESVQDLQAGGLTVVSR